MRRKPDREIAYVEIALSSGYHMRVCGLQAFCWQQWRDGSISDYVSCQTSQLLEVLRRIQEERQSDETLSQD